MTVHHNRGSRRLVIAPEPDQTVPEPDRATPEPDRATLRATARQLSDQGISNREIGRRLGISKDKVKRLLTEHAAQTTPGASHDEPDRATPETEPDMPETTRATTEPTTEPPSVPEPPTPPTIDRMTITVPPRTRSHLDVLAAGGLTDQHAVICAVALVADAVAAAWDRGTCPRGVLPDLKVLFRARPPAPLPSRPDPEVN